MDNFLNRSISLLGIFFSVLVFLAGCTTAPVEPTPLPQITFQQYTNQAAFDMLYPSDWTFDIITEGILLFTRPDSMTLDLDEPTPSIVVLRKEADVRLSIQEEFDHYLQSGPLNGGYTELSEIESVIIEQLEAYQTTVENSAETATTSHIVVTRTAGNVDYVITATAPTSTWDQWWPSYKVILGSITFNE